MQRKNPTRPGKNSTVSFATERRRLETFEAACQINRASVNWTFPGQVGLCKTAVKKCAENVLVDVFSTNTKIVKRVIHKILSKSVNDYEQSNYNMIRSINVYYSCGIMGKRKCDVYRASRYTCNTDNTRSVCIKVNNSYMPRLLQPHNKLINTIKSIDIGKVYSVRETLCDGLDKSEKVDGVYRNIKEMFLRLARYYLCQKRYELLWFQQQTYTFYISLLRDGSCFGKHEPHVVG